MFFFSGPKGWKKKKKIPHRLPLKEQSITFQDFMNPPMDASFFSRELDMYYSSFLAGNVHTDIFLFRLLWISLFSSEELLSIAG